MKSRFIKALALGAIGSTILTGCSVIDEIDRTLQEFELETTTSAPATSAPVESVVSSAVTLDSLNTAKANLDVLPIRSVDETIANQGGYNADYFGYPAKNITQYGWGEEVAACNTRGAVLYTYSQYPEWSDQSKCQLSASNYWTDKYGFYDKTDGEWKFITSDNPKDFDAEHIVARKDAWVSGAIDMDEATRFSIGNDPLNFLLAGSSANRSKGDSSPEDYLPVGEDRCIYVERYINVKHKYTLSITEGDYTALSTALDECITAVQQ